MKKLIFFFVFILFISSFIFPDTFGKKVHKTVLINNEKVYRWVKLNGITKYNRNGKEIYAKTIYSEQWREYDDKGHEIYWKMNGGFETWNDYDEKGNLIHYKSIYPYQDDYEEWMEYDDEGRQVYSKDTMGNENIWEYDENGELIHWRMGEWYEEWYDPITNNKKCHFKQIRYTDDDQEYIEEGDCIEEGNSCYTYYTDGTEEIILYNDRYQVIYEKNKDGTEVFYKYNDKNQLIYKKNADGTEEWYEPKDKTILKELDSNNNIIHYKDSDKEYWYEYDSKGNKTYYRDNKNIEYWYEYDFYPNGVIMTVRQYLGV